MALAASMSELLDLLLLIPLLLSIDPLLQPLQSTDTIDAGARSDRKVLDRSACPWWPLQIRD